MSEVEFIEGDDRSPDLRIWDEALKTFYEEHRRLGERKLLKTDTEHDMFWHLKTCQQCWSSIQQHAVECSDGALLLAKLEDLKPPIIINTFRSS